MDSKEKMMGIKVKKEVYLKCPEVGVSAVLGVRYIGRHGVCREENKLYERSSDWSDTLQKRISKDNGRTWSDWEMILKEWPAQKGFDKMEALRAQCYDPKSGKTLGFVFQRIFIGKGPEAYEKYWAGTKTFFGHNFWQVSDDDGKTWGKKHLLRYEDGPDFNPENWGNKEYLHTNQIETATNAIATREGAIIYSPCGTPLEITDRGRKETVNAVRCFIGKWDGVKNNYKWEISEPIYVPHRVSGRGFDEPFVAELSDGRLFLVMRGSNKTLKVDHWEGKVESPGRKWMSISDDGGRTWSSASDLRYDTGEQFYSPASIHRMFRHSVTGKLYWVGNICPQPPQGNSPRYPLIIAEVNETIPALKKDAVTVIDDRDPKRDSEYVQFSNFSLLEDRETHQVEIYLTPIGEKGGKEPDLWTAGVSKYTLTFPVRE